MKKLLKFILMPILVATPAMSVVACSPSTQFSADQILNIALGRMITGTFKMKGESGDIYKLGLDKLPANGDKYESLTPENQAIISSYFKSLVTANSGSSAGNWEYPTVNVNISQLDDFQFITRYNGKIQSKITLNAQLNYSGLTKNKSITVIIFNDQTRSTEKAQALADSVKTQLNTSSQETINLDTLPANNSSGNMPDVFNKFAASLRSTWVNPNPTAVNKKDETDWLVDVIGNVQITIDYSQEQKLQATAQAKDDVPFYKLSNPAISEDKKFINAEISNLQINFTYMSPYNKDSGTGQFNTSELDQAGQKIKVQQSTGSSMQNQLRIAISAPSIKINFNQMSSPPAPPTEGQEWGDYVKTADSVNVALKNFIFYGSLIVPSPTTSATSGIYSVYPSDLVNITMDAFKVSTTSSKFTMKNPDSKIGSFTLTFTLTDNVVEGQPVTLTSNSVEVWIIPNAA